MANKRTGTYGIYYGSYFNESSYLSESEREVNAKYIYSYLTNKGWTINAISALLGNMHAESSINPGRWQSDSIGWETGGYGLVQWTPTTKYINWCSENGLSDPSEMDNNLARIIYEVENKIQWYGTDRFPWTFEEFTKSSEPCSTLAVAFLLCYERPSDQSESVQEYRGSLANTYYTIISGSEPSEPVEPGTPNKQSKSNFNFIFYQAHKRYLNRRKKNEKRRIYN